MDTNYTDVARFLLYATAGDVVVFSRVLEDELSRNDKRADDWIASCQSLGELIQLKAKAARLLVEHRRSSEW